MDLKQIHSKKKKPFSVEIVLMPNFHSVPSLFRSLSIFVLPSLYNITEVSALKRARTSALLRSRSFSPTRFDFVFTQTLHDLKKNAL